MTKLDGRGANEGAIARMTSARALVFSVGAFLGLGACVQIVGIEDPILGDETSSSGSSSSSSSSSGSSSSGSSSGGSSSSSSSSSGSSSGGSLDLWANWRMPNPAGAGLPNPASYSLGMPNDVVTDNVTGLVWQRMAEAQPATWSEAKTYCETLTHEGSSDWRLPTRIELVSLIDFTKPGPTIDMTYFPNTPPEVFWTSSLSLSAPSNAWFVNFANGLTGATIMMDPHLVRCVRGG